MKKWLSVLFFLFVNLDAFAVHPTQGPLQQHPALCNYGYNPNCGQSASPSPEKIIQHININVPSKYGALAHDRYSSVAGGSMNADSLEQAKKQAIQQCSQGGKNKRCEIILWVRNGCIAAAIGKSGKTWTITKAAEKPGEAERMAMKRCKKSGASDCRILAPESCSVPEGMYQ